MDRRIPCLGLYQRKDEHETELGGEEEGAVQRGSAQPFSLAGFFCRVVVCLRIVFLSLELSSSLLPVG